MRIFCAVNCYFAYIYGTMTIRLLKTKLTHVMSKLYGKQTVTVSVVTHGHALYTVTVMGAGTGLQHGRHCKY